MRMNARPHTARQLALDELLPLSPAADSPATGRSRPGGIDHAFPEEFANTLSRSEAFNKHLFRPNTYLHKWWARRCGSTFRTILKQFVADPERRDYYAPGGLEGKVVLDPMMGGGTTLHEAIRLGASVIGADIDPIPVVQARASLAQVALPDLQAAFERFFADLYQRVGHYFQTECPACGQTVDSQYTLHGVRKRCACGESVQIDQYELRHEGYRIIRIWPDTWAIQPTPPSSFSMREEGVSPPRIGEGPGEGFRPPDEKSMPRLILKGETVCPACQQRYQDLLDEPFYARYVPLAVVGQCPRHGLFFRAPGEADLTRIRRANELRAGLDLGPAEGFAVRDGPKSGDLLTRNVRSYLDVFSSRQLLYLYHAIQLLRDYSGAIRLNLALLVSTSLEFNALLCGYKGWSTRRPGAIRHVFALHAYAFQYTVAENNPVNRARSSGNLQQLFRDRIERGRKWAIAPVERWIDQNGKAHRVTIRGEVDGGTEVFDQAALTRQQQAFWLIHGDSRRLPIESHSVDIIVTDPPYYDNVQYSDLATFFRVWLARLLPDEADWTYDETRSAVATQAADDDTGFIAVLSGIFRECGRVLKRDTGRLVFTFHHWDPNAWAELTIALQQAGFRLVNAHVVFSENPISSHIQNLKALTHDAILVLAIDGDEYAARRWPPLETIDTSDSETFCRQCGAALGWLLESECAPGEMRAMWKQLFDADSLDRKQPYGRIIPGRRDPRLRGDDGGRRADPHPLPHAARGLCRSR